MADDALAGDLEAAELLDVDVDELARLAEAEVLRLRV